MNFTRLLTVLKFKTKQNSCYYIVKEDVELNNQDFKIYKGAMLLNVNLTPSIPEHLYLSVMYKVKPIGSAITIADAGEGLIQLEYKDLASLLIADRIEAYYVDRSEPDKEIAELIDRPAETNPIS
jgi:hypothetical protein